MKVLFVPVSVITGLLAGALGRWLFSQVWGVFDDEEPPESEHLEAPWAKIMLAAAVKGAIFTAVKTAVDRGLRLGYMNITGSWPGEIEPEPD